MPWVGGFRVPKDCHGGLQVSTRLSGVARVVGVFVGFVAVLRPSISLLRYGVSITTGLLLRNLNYVPIMGTYSAF